MSSITLPFVFTPGEVLTAQDLNDNFQTIYNDYNGNIDNANIATNAGIALTKLQLNPGVEAFNQQASGTNFTWASGLTTDTTPEITFTAGGFLLGGPGGSTTPDVGLHRSAAGTWQLTSPSGTPTAPILDMNGGSIINLTSFFAPQVQGLRVSISSTTPVPSDGTTTTIYALPYTSGSIALYNASNQWVIDQVTSLSIAVPATTNTAYDVYIFDNAGVATIGLAAWTGSTPPTRGTQNGVPYTNNSVNDRWIGSIATNSTSGTVEDSAGNRLVWNYNNQVQRNLFAQIPVASWTYNTSAWRSSNSNTTTGQGRVGVLAGLANSIVEAQFVQGTSSSGEIAYAGINVDSTTATPNLYVGNNSGTGPITATNTFSLATGIHYLQMMEAASGPSTTVFTGNPSWVATNGYGQSWLSGALLS